MTQALIDRYRPGGDIYATLASQYGTPAANSIALAAETGDERAVNAALVNVKYGGQLSTSTIDIFGNQILTDPLAAPLAGANNLIGNSVLAFLKNPFVLLAVAVVLFVSLGGFGWLKRKIATK